MGLEGKLFRHYRILHLIGKGGLCEVYVLEERRTQRRVAARFMPLQRLRSELENAEGVLERFWREVTAAAHLRHPALLPLYDHGEEYIEDVDLAYLVMPYRHAGSLRHWLQKRRQATSGEALDLELIGRIIEPLSQGLQFVHEHGMMHLDVKPASIFIHQTAEAEDLPQVQLGDFGMAGLGKALHSSAQTTSLYLAPEQRKDQPTFASDQYALGKLAYNLLGGDALDEELAKEENFFDPVPVHSLRPDVSPEVDEVLRRALAEDPEQRFPSIAAFGQAFALALLGEEWLQKHREEQQARLSGRDSGELHRLFSSRPSEERTEDGQEALSEVSPSAPHAATSSVSQEVIHQAEPSSTVSEPAALALSSSRTTSEEGEQSLTEEHGASGATAVQKPGRETPVQQRESSRKRKRSLRNAQGKPSSEDTVLPSPGRRTGVRTLATVAIVVLSILVVLGASLGGYHVVTNIQHDQATATVLREQGATATALALIPGNAWQVLDSGTKSDLLAVVWTGSQFVVVGENGTILTSPDGKQWSEQSSGTHEVLRGIAWSGSQFVAIGYFNTVLTSPDGKTWTPQTVDNGRFLSALTWSGSQFVALNGSTFLTSPDGKTWTAQTSGSSQTLTAIAWSGSQFVAVGEQGTILTSPDGKTWTSQTSGTQNILRSVVWSGSRFVAVGDADTILTSPDGKTWTSQASGSGAYLRGVTWSGSRFVATGYYGTILTSTDSKSWIKQPAGTGDILRSVAWSGSHLVAVGSDGTILTSP